MTDGVELHVDLGWIGDRPFVNNASFGAYAAVVQSPAYRADKARTTLDMLPEFLAGHRGARLRTRAGNVTIDGPQAVLVSNNAYGMGDVAGLGRRARLDGGALGVVGITIDSAVQAAGLLRGRHARGLARLAADEVVIQADESSIPGGSRRRGAVAPDPGALYRAAQGAASQGASQPSGRPAAQTADELAAPAPDGAVVIIRGAEAARRRRAASAVCVSRCSCRPGRWSRSPGSGRP